MKKSMKKALILSVVAGALTLTAAIAATKTTTQTVSAPTGTEAVLEVAVLRQGARGGEVKEVQRRLKLWGYYNGSVDGVFGAGTVC